MTGFGGVAVAPVVNGAFSEALIWVCALSRAFGAGFGTGTVCADDAVMLPASAAAIASASAERRRGPEDLLVIRTSRLPFNASPRFVMALLSRFGPEEVSFFRENMTQNQADLRIRPLPRRPESPACRRDWRGRRCLRVPCAPSARRRGYSRFAAGAGCSWSRPSGRA